jgi:hypothetical protein
MMPNMMGHLQRLRDDELACALGASFASIV